MTPFLLAGFFVGVANVVPGISGGTFLLLLGVHSFVIEAVSAFSLKKRMFGLDRNSLSRILLLIAGALVGILSMAKLMGHLLSISSAWVYLFFFGLILGSLDPLWKQIDRKKVQTWVWLGLGFLLVLLVSFLKITTTNPEIHESVTSVGAEGPFQGYVILFFAGLVSAATMLIPGVSGSMLLVILGMYPLVVDSVANFRVFPVLIIAIGACFGIWVSAVLIRKLMHRFQNGTYSLLTGMVIGSLALLWMVKGNLTGVESWLITIICASAGFACGRFLNRLHRYHFKH
jgi:putative membrane protein